MKIDLYLPEILVIVSASAFSEATVAIFLIRSFIKLRESDSIASSSPFRFWIAFLRERAASSISLTPSMSSRPCSIPRTIS